MFKRFFKELFCKHKFRFVKELPNAEGRIMECDKCGKLAWWGRGPGIP